MSVTMESFDGIRNNTRWIVLYGGPQDDEGDFHFWGAVQTREEAVWEAYQREKHGWRTHIISPTPEVYDPLPTYRQSCERVQQGIASRLDWFIYDHEPSATVAEAEEFRRRLATWVRQSGGTPPHYPDELR